TTTTTTLPPPPSQQQSTAEAMMMKRIGKLEHVMANLIQENKGLEERLDRHGARLYKLEQLDIPHQVSKAKKKSRESPKTPPGSPPHPPPPPPAGPSEASRAPGASRSSQVPPPLPLPSSTNQEIFSMYGYDYMKKIVLRRVNLNEHVIAERDFKYLFPSDFEDLYLLNLQSHLNHLPSKDKKILTTAVNQWTRQLVIQQRVKDFPLGIESYQTQLNLTKPQWNATGFEYKHDYTVIDSPRAVMFQDKYGVQMMMRFNDIHKFNNGTLQQINEALDYRVKEFRINRMNPGLNTRFWTRKDVDRSKAFMFSI
nr:hypothetical protein [Tanacetum cinerariifolium]